MVTLTSQVATEDGDEDFVGSEVSATTNEDSNLEGVHQSWSTIRELVGDLESLGVTPKNGCYNYVMDGR